MRGHLLSLIDLDMADFAERLRELRSQRHLTQARVAELVGVGLRVYHRWERGGAAPHFETLLKLADVLGVSLDELAGRTAVADDARIKNAELHQLVREVDQLPDAEQQALILVIDSMVKRAKLHRMAGASPKKRATSSARGGAR
jgi:transcriptional regulator with XRE-family HTH domain